jgi:hypothetical protein
VHCKRNSDVTLPIDGTPKNHCYVAIRFYSNVAQIHPLGWWARAKFRQVPADSKPPTLLSYIEQPGVQGDLTKPWPAPPAAWVYLSHFAGRYK